MTKEEIIGGAFLKLTGGYPSTDNSTWWDDVDLLFGPAVNFVMTQDYFISKREEGEEKILQPLFLHTYKNIAITYDSDEEKFKSLLPVSPIALPKNRAVSFVGTITGDPFIPVDQGGGVMQQYFSCFKVNQTSYELEGLEITYHNLPPLLESGNVMVKMIVSAKGLTDSDEVLLPEGGEFQVMTMMVEFFTGQRQLPKDYYNSNKEPQPAQ